MWHRWRYATLYVRPLSRSTCIHRNRPLLTRCLTWIIEKLAPYTHGMRRVVQADLDNLRLAELPQPPAGAPALHAEFQLEALLLTGQCIDTGAATRQDVTPRGVQLWAGRGTERHLRDTLVMANLGYFQLQASPGAWAVHLAPGVPPFPHPHPELPASTLLCLKDEGVC